MSKSSSLLLTAFLSRFNQLFFICSGVLAFTDLEDRHGLWQAQQSRIVAGRHGQVHTAFCLVITAFYMFKSRFGRHIQHFKVVLGVTDPSWICTGSVTATSRI